MAEDSTTKEYFEHSRAPRIDTTGVITASLKKQYPNLECTILHPYFPCDLLGFAYSGHGSIHRIPDGLAKRGSMQVPSAYGGNNGDTLPSSLALTGYIAPSRRTGTGAILHEILFDKFLYKWNGHEFLVYVVDAIEGLVGAFPQGKIFFVLSPSLAINQGLILAAGQWTSELHDEVLVFDQGVWQKSRELFESVRNAKWEDVILDSEMKKTIIEDHMSFFSSRETYAKLRVPWKRGVLYYGPPGNGKTISVKAMMHQLYNLKDPIPTLYVRTLTSFYGPEKSVQLIFNQARRMAPCYLIFEDLDTIITDEVKSYFFNEVDGLKSNDGIFMVGSTNHLDRLDPGISQRPSRFDRKYLFGNPSMQERIMYCQYWQRKLEDNKNIEFPDKLCKAIAEITYDFSFAYIQESFVAALLAIARKTNNSKHEYVARSLSTQDLADDWVSVLGSDNDDDLDQYMLWTEIQKQINILRGGMDKERN